MGIEKVMDEILSEISRRRWLVLAVVLGALLIGVTRSITSPPTYRYATSSLVTSDSAWDVMTFVAFINDYVIPVTNTQYENQTGTVVGKSIFARQPSNGNLIVIETEAGEEDGYLLDVLNQINMMAREYSEAAVSGKRQDLLATATVVKSAIDEQKENIVGLSREFDELKAARTASFEMGGALYGEPALESPTEEGSQAASPAHRANYVRDARGEIPYVLLNRDQLLSSAYEGTFEYYAALFEQKKKLSESRDLQLKTENRLEALEALSIVTPPTRLQQKRFESVLWIAVLSLMVGTILSILIVTVMSVVRRATVERGQ